MHVMMIGFRAIDFRLLNREYLVYECVLSSELTQQSAPKSQTAVGRSSPSLRPSSLGNSLLGRFLGPDLELVEQTLVRVALVSGRWLSHAGQSWA